MMNFESSLHGQLAVLRQFSPVVYHASNQPGTVTIGAEFHFVAGTLKCRSGDKKVVAILIKTILNTVVVIQEAVNSSNERLVRVGAYRFCEEIRHTN